MERRRAESAADEEAIVRSTGNVFADLGYSNADERRTKLRLAQALNAVIARQRLPQGAAAEKHGVNQPKTSALANYRLSGFSVECLMTFLTALDHDVEIVISKKPRSRAAARISVVTPAVKYSWRGSPLGLRPYSHSIVPGGLLVTS